MDQKVKRKGKLVETERSVDYNGGRRKRVLLRFVLMGARRKNGKQNGAISTDGQFARCALLRGPSVLTVHSEYCCDNQAGCGLWE